MNTQASARVPLGAEVVPDEPCGGHQQRVEGLGVGAVAHSHGHEAGQDHEAGGHGGVVALVAPRHLAGERGEREDGERGGQPYGGGGGFAEERAQRDEPGIEREDGAGASLEVEGVGQEVAVFDDVPGHSGHDCLVAGAHFHEGQCGQEQQRPDEEQRQVVSEEVPRGRHGSEFLCGWLEFNQ